MRPMRQENELEDFTEALRDTRISNVIKELENSKTQHTITNKRELTYLFIGATLSRLIRRVTYSPYCSAVVQLIILNWLLTILLKFNETIVLNEFKIIQANINFIECYLTSET